MVSIGSDPAHFDDRRPVPTHRRPIRNTTATVTTTTPRPMASAWDLTPSTSSETPPVTSRSLASIWSRVIFCSAVLMPAPCRTWVRGLAPAHGLDGDGGDADHQNGTDHVRDPRQVAGEGAAGLALEEAQEAHRQDGEADRERHRSATPNTNVAAEPLDRLERLLLDVVDDEGDDLLALAAQSTEPSTAVLPAWRHVPPRVLDRHSAGAGATVDRGPAAPARPGDPTAQP